MELKITPTAELSLNLGGKKIGRLEALCIDLSNGGGLFGVPKVKLSISIRAAEFGGDTKKLDELINKVSKFKFLDVSVIK